MGLGDIFKSSNKTKSEVKLGKDAKKYLYPLLDQGLQRLGEGAPGFYPFNTVAPLDPYQLQAIDDLAGYGGDISGALTDYGLEGTDILSRYYGTNQGVTNDQINQFYNSDRVESQVDAVTADTNKFLDRYLGTNLASRADMTGNDGSKWAQQGATAIGEAARGLQGVTAGIRDQGWRDASNLAMNNADLASRNMAVYGNQVGSALPNAYNFGGNNINNMMTSGNMLRGFNQENIGQDMQRHLWDYNQGWDLMNRYYGISSPLYGMTTTNTKGTYSPGLGEIGMALGSAALGGGYSPWSATPAASGNPVGSMYNPNFSIPYTGGYGGFMPTMGGPMFNPIQAVPTYGGFGMGGYAT